MGGRCVLTPNESGRILDRLAGLEKVITPDLIRQVLAETNRFNKRACTLTHEVMLWVVLAMGILTDLPIRQVFKNARRLRSGEESPSRSSLCVARQRLGVAPVQSLFHKVVRPLASRDTPGAFYHGLRRMAIDGTVMDVPDTLANAEAFGRPSWRWGVSANPQVEFGRGGNAHRSRLSNRVLHDKRTGNVSRLVTAYNARHVVAVGPRLF